MKFLLSIMMAACAVVALSFLVAADDARYDDYRVSGPFTHENLDVFFIHGSDLVADENLLTLDEALKQGKVIVHETGNVQELTIENVSNYWIYIHAGDIVKGGQQDRVIRVDIIIKPRSGRMPLPSFCVEHGRWSQRGGENVAAFDASPNMVSSKELKLAAKYQASQQEVWSEVEAMQDKLEAVAEAPVRDNRSSSSLQLTLEDKDVQALTREYIDAISTAMKGDDIIGFAFAINGEINSADIYRSHDLFLKMWPKLAEACAIEAVSVRHEDGGNAGVTARDITFWLEQAEGGQKSEQRVNDITRLKLNEGAQDVIFETIDSENEKMIHKNVIKR